MHSKTATIHKCILVLFGTLVWIQTMYKSGSIYSYGMGFWGANGHDGIWHIAIAEGLSKGSLLMPIFSGLPIQNYHLGFAILLAVVHKITSIPVIFLYFKLVPLIFSVLIGLLTYKFVKNWTQSHVSAWWSTFLVYFGGSLGWVFSKGESVFWSQQSISTLINPPFALSLIFLLLALLFAQQKRYILSGVTFGLLIYIKVYIGLLVLLALFITSIKERALLKSFLISGSMFIIYLLIFKQSASLIKFQPGWFIESIFSQERLDIPKFYSALNTYRISNNFLKGIPALSLGLIIFILGNLGSRIIFVIYLLKNIFIKKHFDWTTIFSLSVIVVGTTVTSLFTQSGTAWNTIQFFYYSIFFAAIISGRSMELLLSKVRSKILQLIISGLFILITIPTTFDTLHHYLPNRPPSKISITELEALNKLKDLPNGIVLTQPAAINTYAPPPRALYEYESTAYVTAISQKVTFLADEVNLNITGFEWPHRKKLVENFFKFPSLEFLKSNHIKYIYVVKSLLSSSKVNIPATLVFENSEVILFSLPE